MFGAKIQEIRKRLGLSQGQIADQLGVDTSLVSRWEKGEREPSVSQQLDLAHALGVTVDYLVNGKLGVDFKLRANIPPSKKEEKKAILQALTDAEQQINFIEAAYQLANKQPKPFLLNVNLSGNQYEEAADEIRDLLRLNQRVTLNELKEALAERNVFIFSWNMPPELSGMAYRGNFAVIFINALQTLERQLFTVAHEAVHLICHLCPPRSGCNPNEETENATVSIASTRTDPLELEANKLAAEIVMSTKLMRSIEEEYSQQIENTLFVSVIAQYFNVSRDAMFYRLAERGKLSWGKKGKYVKEFNPIPWRPQPRVTDIHAQIAPDFLRLGLALYDKGEISSSKLSEWFGVSIRRIEEYLNKIEDDEGSSAELAANFAN